MKFDANDLNGLSDEQLVFEAKISEEAMSALISRYSRMIWIKSETFKNSLTESDDLTQEGLLGLVNAVFNFRIDKNVKFSTFADVCVSNRMKSLVSKSVKNSKNDAKVENIEDISSDIDIFNPETPESIYLYKEYYSDIFLKINEILTDIEHKVFIMRVRDMSYKSIAEKLNITEKIVDNAMQRARRKVKRIFSER